MVVHTWMGLIVLIEGIFLPLVSVSSPPPNMALFEKESEYVGSE